MIANNETCRVGGKVYFFNPFNYSYFNKTTGVYLEIINNLPGVERFAFGRKPEISENFVLIYSPFVFMGASVENFNLVLTRLKKYYDVNLASISFDLAHEYYKSFRIAHGRAKASIAVLTEYDLHALNNEDPVVNFAWAHRDFILTAGPELYDLHLHSKEVHFDLDPDLVASAYDRLKRYNDKVISMTHTMGNNEILDVSEINFLRKWRDICIPGIGYVARKDVAKELSKVSRLGGANILFDRTVYALGRQLPGARFRQKLLWNYFRSSIGNSRIGMTCGSSSGYFVRKFLEIPALGSCLCTFNYSFLPMIGFNPGSEYLPISKPSEITNYFKRMKDPDFIEETRALSISAMMVAKRQHSITARSAQLEETIRRIFNSDFRGSYWADGEYKFHHMP